MSTPVHHHSDSRASTQLSAIPDLMVHASKLSGQLFICRQCNKSLPTSQGLSSHYSQSPACMAAVLAQNKLDTPVNLPTSNSTSDFQPEEPPSKCLQVMVEDDDDDDDDDDEDDDEDDGPPVIKVHSTAAQCHPDVFRTQ
ncbi:hypothetical protein FRC02_004828 [Tulasnella sp. 418]|nr:hypothetical protein FRC02_004828 [Tulasnella sp. 418]